jgi:hypothetical protein
VSIDLANELYTREIGQVVARPARGGSLQVIARLAEVQIADPVRDVDARNTVRDQLRRLYGTDLTDAYRQYLEARHKVTVNRAALDQLF